MNSSFLLVRFWSILVGCDSS
ncbi:hypothetical protein V2J09_021216 [Rumex salicifolius]